MKRGPGIQSGQGKAGNRHWWPLIPGSMGFVVILAIVLVSPAMGMTPGNVVVSGHVYEGTRGDDSSPAGSVRLLIAPSSAPDRYDPGDIILETKTDSTGFYEFQFLPRATGIDTVMPGYYHVVIDAPSGSALVDATSLSGTINNPGWIVLRYPFASTEVDGNDFWFLSPQQGDFNQTFMTIPAEISPGILGTTLTDGNTSSAENTSDDQPVAIRNNSFYGTLTNRTPGWFGEEERVPLTRIQQTLQLSPSSGYTGDIVTATGGYFSSPYLPATGSVDTARGLASLSFEGITVGEEIPVDTDGSFTTTFTVPAGITPGQHLVQAASGQDVAGATFTIINTPPEAVIDASPLSGSVPFQVQFDASRSSDPDGSVSTYQWDFGDDTTASGVTAGHNYARTGRYEVRLTATDNMGEPGTASVEITVINSPPVAVATTSRVSDKAPLTFMLDGSRSYDPEGRISEYFWDFGDGKEGSGITTEHTYPGPGGYNATLIVTDDQGESGTTSVLIPVDNSPPVAVVDVSPLSGSVPLQVQFDASKSKDTDGSIVSYLWDFGDGSQASGITAENTYTGPGRYDARLKVTDDYGATDSITLQIGVNNSPPVAVATADPESGSDPLTVRFNGSGSYDPDGQIRSYLWDLGDGNREEISSPVHVYQNPGTYQAVLIVTDDGGMTGQKSIDITVGNMPPVAHITVSATEGNAPMNVLIDGSGSTDPDNDNLTYSWEFGDGESGTGSTVSHAYREEGSYPLSLKVSDPHGSTDRATVPIRVVPPFPYWLVLVILSGIVITINEIRRRRQPGKKVPGERVVGPGELLPEDCEYPVPKPGYEIGNSIEYGPGTTRELPNISVDFRSGIWKKREEK